jgi:2-keto-4-pentenoate hydratase/2-oxohepta-3-ene-1,7-dioic acid hydratase in catechol pathway
MKLLRYGKKGQEKPGMLDKAGKLRDLSATIADINPETLAPAALDKLRKLDPASLPLVPGEPRIGACLTQIPKIVCVGLNYTDHAKETGSPIPKEPILFMKATSSLNGPNDEVMLPKGSQKGDWEVELGGQWTKGKSADTFCPIGPWLVTADEVPDPGKLDLFCEVNGKMMQKGTTVNLIFHVAHIVSYISHFMTLMPGDVIPTGTPAGVGLGMKPPVFLKAGDTMRLGISGLGEQRQKVVAFRE